MRLRKEKNYRHHIRHKTRRYYIVLGIRTIGNFFILFSATWLVIVFTPFLKSETKFRVDEFQHKTYSIDKPKGPTFATLLKQAPPLLIEPVNKQASIVVERIDANSPIIFNVDPGDEAAYKAALLKGVGHAQGTVLPGEKGNSYMFAHSVGNPWDIARYNAVFYLLREVEKGDRVVIFRDGWRYDFRVYDKQIVEPTDVHFLTADYPEPVITLQTCWPPGTVLKRLLVFARLEKSYPPENINPLLSLLPGLSTL